MTTRHQRIMWSVFLVMLISYALPWITTGSSGLTLNAYDLAEWSNLHPEAHSLISPALLLRVQLVLLTWLLALHQPKPFNTLLGNLSILALLLLLVAQLPPVEFFRTLDDPNQQQQISLLLTTLLGLLVIIAAPLPLPFRRWLSAGFLGVAVLSSLTGYVNAWGLLQIFSLAPAIMLDILIYQVAAGVGMFISLKASEPR